MTRDSLPRAASSRDLAPDLLALLATLAQEPSASSSSSAFVDDLAVRFGCERVSLGWVRGKRARVAAISLTSRVDRKQGLVADIEAAMDEAFDHEAVVREPAPEEAKPLMLRAHPKLKRVSGAGAVCSIPVSDGQQIYGVLTLEHSQPKPVTDSDLNFCEAALRLAGPLLHLKWLDERWLGSKVLSAAGRQKARLFARGRDGRKVVAGLLLALGLFLCVGSGEHRVSALASLEGSLQRAAVAPFDGYVAEASVRAGDVVREGDVLCALDPRELQLEHERWTTQQDKLSKRKRQALAKMDAAEVRVISAEIQQAEAQRALAEYQLARTQIVAPISGIVVSGDMSQSLGAPVQRGEVLFEVAPLDSYRIVLEIDERDVAPVTAGQRGRLVLTALSSESLPFTVETVMPVSTSREGRNYFRVEARFDEPPTERLRPGMRGAAKIEVGRRNHVWLWTHDLTDWLRWHLWAWTP